MIEQEIREELFRLQDAEYRDFQSALIPTVARSSFIGVRTPSLRALAKRYVKKAEISVFLSELPHRYFDENQLHAFIISEINDFSLALREVERFLPYVDNWATCDQMSPKAFRKNKTELLPAIERWLRSEHAYTVRFAVGMLMTHFLDEDFDPAYLEQVASIRSEEYYVKMMVAWYFATALAKQYDAAVPYITGKCLAPWTHNKAIQKALESYRVSPERKTLLKGLKVSVRP